jgi:phage baseplate assembly protein W
MHLTSPYRVDGTGRTATTADRAAHARALIGAVLFTAPGERVMRPDFGAGLRTLLFDANSDAMETAAEFLIRAALQAHLSEIVSLVEVVLSREEGTLTIRLVYDLRDTGERVATTFSAGEV